MASSNDNNSPREETYGTILDTPVTDELATSFLEYAMSVIVARALPDVRDGLKPVHRRILYGLYDRRLWPGSSYVKCAKVTGHVMGDYHPHGDQAIYDALVRMSQDFSLRLPLVDGHGNFGSLGGDDPPAAQRYTECRMAPAAVLMVDELSEDTVDFKDSYDGKTLEPTVLPSAFPNLLVNGSQGIAVGMATNIPPHNLVEVIAACRHLLAHPDAPTEELLDLIPGPDLPCGASIVGTGGIREAYLTGRGTFKMQATAEITDVTPRRRGIVVTELPYAVGTEKIVSKIKELVGDKKLNGISDVKDLSDRKRGLHLVIECKTGFEPKAVLRDLYRLTSLEESFGVNTVALVAGQPRILTLRELLEFYVAHRLEVVSRRTAHRLAKAEARAHIVDGLLKALSAIDEVVVVIKGSRDTDIARKRLQKSLSLSETQASHILEMPLRRLTSLELQKLKDELRGLRGSIAELRRILDSDSILREVVSDELAQVAAQLGTPRRTRLLDHVADEPEVALETPDEPCLVVLSPDGLIDRRGVEPTSRSKKPAKSDLASASCVTSTRAMLAGITNRGRYLTVPVSELPELDVTNRLARGGPGREFFELEGDEHIVGLVGTNLEGVGLALATELGSVKRLGFDALPSRSGQSIVSLREHDSVIGVVVLPREQDLVFVSSSAHLLRTSSTNVRAQGRGSAGMAGMHLVEDAKVIAFSAVDDEDDAVVLVTLAEGREQSYKRSRLVEYPTKGRGTGGVRCHTFRQAETGLVAARMSHDPIYAVGSRGEAVSLDADLSRRDASGTRLEKSVVQLAGRLS